MTTPTPDPLTIPTPPTDDPQLRALLDLLNIDESNLPLEHTEQAKRYTRVAQAAAEATGLALRTKFALGQFLAKQDIALRQFEPSGNVLPGGVKRTETSIENTIKSMPDYAVLHEAYVKAIETEFFLDKLLRAFEQRAWALKYLSLPESGRGGRSYESQDDAFARTAAENIARMHPDPRR